LAYIGNLELHLIARSEMAHNAAHVDPDASADYEFYAVWVRHVSLEQNAKDLGC